jgi:two-component system sensor histidine kinase BarA
MAFAEILLAEGETLSSLQKEYLQDIFESGHQLLSQINDILNMSKIEAGLAKINCSQVDIREVLDHLIHTVSPLVSKKGLTLAIDILPEVPCIVADREKITHIFRNIVGNAIKFTPTGGTITITGALVDHEGKIPEIEINIKDSGIGISLVDQQHIFDKFRQADSAESREYPGSGLGLALAQNLVGMHGGRIWVESEIGQGSIFTFVLPVIAKGC